MPVSRPSYQFVKIGEGLKGPVWMYMDSALLQRLIFGWIRFTVADVYPVWMYMDPALLQRLIFGWIGFTVADVYPASVCGQKYHRREPRWISACFLLIGSKTSTFALPVHTSGLRSYGMCRLTIPCQVAAILSGVSSCFCLVVSFPQAVCGAMGPRYSSFLDKIDQIIRAFLFAIATATIFGCRRSRIWLIQTLLASCLPPAFPSTALAPWIKSVRRYRSPRLLIPNNRDFPPLDRCLGTKPNQAAN